MVTRFLVSSARLALKTQYRANSFCITRQAAERGSLAMRWLILNRTASHFCLENTAPTKKRCGGRCGNFWITKRSGCFSRTASRFCPERAIACGDCWVAIAECHSLWTRKIDKVIASDSADRYRDFSD